MMNVDAVPVPQLGLLLTMSRRPERAREGAQLARRGPVIDGPGFSIDLTPLLLCRLEPLLEELAAIYGDRTDMRGARRVQSGGGVKEMLFMLVVAILSVIGQIALDRAGFPMTDGRGEFSAVAYRPSIVRPAPGVEEATDTAAFNVQHEKGAPRAAAAIVHARGNPPVGTYTLSPAELAAFRDFHALVLGRSPQNGGVCPAHMTRLGISASPGDRAIVTAQGRASGLVDIDPAPDNTDLCLYDHTAGPGSEFVSPMDDLMRVSARGTFTSPPRRASAALAFIALGPGQHVNAPAYTRDMRWELAAGSAQVMVTMINPDPDRDPTPQFPDDRHVDTVIARALAQQLAAAKSSGMLKESTGTARLITFLGFRGNSGYHEDAAGPMSAEEREAGVDRFVGVLSLTAGLAAGDGVTPVEDVPVVRQEGTLARVVPEEGAAEMNEIKKRREGAMEGPTAFQFGSPEAAIDALPAPGLTVLVRQREAADGRTGEHAVKVDRRKIDPGRQIVVFSMKDDRPGIPAMVAEGRRVTVPIGVQGGGGKKRRKRRSRRAPKRTGGRRTRRRRRTLRKKPNRKRRSARSVTRTRPRRR